ncbi:MAG: sulfite exporter TauE/SafE family protein, partial [Bacteroidetes bacterium]
SFFGSKLALSISDEKLKKVFAILMMIISIKMLFFDKPKTNNQSTAADAHVNKPLPPTLL